jgi:hypothetical protein
MTIYSKTEEEDQGRSYILGKGLQRKNRRKTEQEIGKRRRGMGTKNPKTR